MNNSKKLSVKWNKENFVLDVCLNTIGELKLEIQNKTSVEPNRQKIFFKGKILDDSYSLNLIPDGSLLTMTGVPTLEANININSDKKVLFLEDMTEEQKAKILREKGEDLVYGLQNLGNTCYLNSTLQCIGRVPELRKALEELSTKKECNS